MYRHIAAVVVLSLLTGTASTDTNYRLNTPIKPKAYAIAITPYFDTGDQNAFTFDGEVDITFTTDTIINQIKLHSDDLIFEAGNITLVDSASNIIQVNGPIQFDGNYSFVYINLATELQVGMQYSLKIIYRGTIREDLTGFYRNYYIEKGVKKWLGATQMEPTHARKVFPCFDEPELKATFTLAIDRPATYKPSLANTKLQSTVTAANGYVREIFYPTPIMSTYLVAFLVSEFDAAHQSNNGTREFGVYTRPEAVNQSDYAYDFGMRVVTALGDYYGIDYYSTDVNLRLDHIALPDFRAGAMENWGLIKYREALLLYVPGESTPYYKYRVAQIVAHETTHMWFGNLVTCHWWSNTWLNEGFANYFQDYITEIIEPEVGAGNMLVTGSVYSAYDADSSPAAVPITNTNVNSPAEISGHFGTITYQKAGSVIRMVHHLLGDEAFKFGLNNYLETNKLQSGYPEKMYTALDQGVTKLGALDAYPETNISDVMSSWISQAGHPVLNVNVNYEDNIITLTQKRFYINSSYSTNEIYKIPVTYTTKALSDFVDTKPKFIMSTSQYSFSVANLSQDHSWVIFNVQETGLYRVNYDDHAWQIISSALKGSDREKIHHLNRAKIINDLFALVYSDQVKFSLLYDVLEFLQNETDYSVWYAAVRGLNKLWHSYLGNDALADIEVYSLSLLQKGIDKLGYDVKSTDDFETLRNRMQILELSCKLGHRGCIDHAVALFKGLRHNGTAISPSLRPLAYCIGLRYGDGEDYDYLWNRAKTTNIATESRIISDALGCTSDNAKLKSFLVSMLEENSPIRFQDLTVPLTSVLSNYSHLSVVMEELKQNYTLWNTIYTTMDTVLTTVASVLHTEQDFIEFEEFLSTCTQCTEQARTSAKTTLAQSRAGTDWANSHKDDILSSIRSDSTILTPSLLFIVTIAVMLTGF